MNREACSLIYERAGVMTNRHKTDLFRDQAINYSLFYGRPQFHTISEINKERLLKERRGICLEHMSGVSVSVV